MKRVLITGMSGTGKTTLIEALTVRGHKAVDTDADWPHWLRPLSDSAVAAGDEREWVWREDLLQELLSTEDAEVLFVSGCVSNQGQFYDRFDHIVLLTAPREIMLQRLARRDNNPFGKQPEELARILSDLEAIEPLLRHVASVEIDTSAPLDEVVASVLRLVD
jgi:dephospho-CoA kinase